MRLVVDSNVVFAALIAQNYSLDLLFNDEFQFIAPEFIRIEIEEHKDEIQKKAGLTGDESQTLLDAIFRYVKLVPKEDYESFKEKAKAISPDKDDWPFFALAIRENCPILSNDKMLKQQSAVTVYSAHELKDRKQP